MGYLARIMVDIMLEFARVFDRMLWHQSWQKMNVKTEFHFHRLSHQIISQISFFIIGADLLEPSRRFQVPQGTPTQE